MRILPLVGLMAVAWLLIIVEVYLFFGFVVPLGAVPHDPLEYTANSLLKVGLTFGLGALWFVVMASLTRVYVRSRLKSPTPTPSS